MGRAQKMYWMAKSYVKLGLVEAIKDAGDYFMETGTASADPNLIRLGVWVKSKERAAQDVLVDKDCLQYMDNEIRRMERNRPKRREYIALSLEERARDSALYRHREWERIGLSDKRKEFKIDVAIDKALAYRKEINKDKKVWIW